MFFCNVVYMYMYIYSLAAVGVVFVVRSESNR